MLLTEQCKLLGIFVTKISKISGLFLLDDDQYVGLGRESILKCFVLTKLYKTGVVYMTAPRVMFNINVGERNMRFLQ